MIGRIQEGRDGEARKAKDHRREREREIDCHGNTDGSDSRQTCRADVWCTKGPGFGVRKVCTPHDQLRLPWVLTGLNKLWSIRKATTALRMSSEAQYIGSGVRHSKKRKQCNRATTAPTAPQSVATLPESSVRHRWHQVTISRSHFVPQKKRSPTSDSHEHGYKAPARLVSLRLAVASRLLRTVTSYLKPSIVVGAFSKSTPKPNTACKMVHDVRSLNTPELSSRAVPRRAGSPHGALAKMQHQSFLLP